MIQKSKTFSETYVSVHDWAPKYHLYWWLGVVGFLNPREREDLRKQMSTDIEFFVTKANDPDATFPFELEAGESRLERVLKEVLIRLSAGLQSKVDRFSPKSFEAWIMQYAPESSAPLLFVTSLPLFLHDVDLVETAIQLGKYSQFGFGSKQFLPGTYSVGQALPKGRIHLSILDPLQSSYPWVELFHWDITQAVAPEPRPSVPTAPAEIENPIEMGDAGFEVDFNVKTE